MKPKNNFDLSPLKKPFNFPTHPKDGIRNIKIVMMRLKSYNGEFDVTLKIPRSSNRNIHEIIGEQIDYNSSVIDSLIVKEVIINIELIENQYSKEQKPSFIKVYSSGKYESEDQNPKNIMILTKYFKYWGLVDECNN